MKPSGSTPHSGHVRSTSAPCAIGHGMPVVLLLLAFTLMGCGANGSDPDHIPERIARQSIDELIAQLDVPMDAPDAVRELVARGDAAIEPLMQVLRSDFESLPRVCERRHQARETLGSLGSVSLPVLTAARKAQQEIVDKRDHTLKYQYGTTSADWLVAQFGLEIAQEQDLLDDLNSAWWTARGAAFKKTFANTLSKSSIELRSLAGTQHRMSDLQGKLMILFVAKPGRYLDTDYLDEQIMRFVELRTQHPDWKLLIVNLVDDYTYRLPYELREEKHDWCFTIAHDDLTSIKSIVDVNELLDLGRFVENVFFWLRNGSVLTANCRTPEQRDWTALRIDREQSGLPWSEQADRIFRKFCDAVGDASKNEGPERARALSKELTELGFARSAVARLGQQLSSWWGIRRRMADGCSYESACVLSQIDLIKPLGAIIYFETEADDVAMEIIQLMRERQGFKDSRNQHWHLDRLRRVGVLKDARSKSIAVIYNNSQQTDFYSEYLEKKPSLVTDLFTAVLEQVLRANPESYSVLENACDYDSDELRKSISWIITELAGNDPSAMQLIIRRLDVRDSNYADKLVYVENPGRTAIPALRQYIRSDLSDGKASDSLIPVALQLSEMSRDGICNSAIEAIPEIVEILTSRSKISLQLRDAVCESLSNFSYEAESALPQLRTLQTETGNEQEWLSSLIGSIENSIAWKNRVDRERARMR